MKHRLITLVWALFPVSLAAQTGVASPQPSQLHEALRRAESSGLDMKKVQQGMAQMSPEGLQAAIGMSGCIMNGLGEEGMMRMQQRGSEMSKHVQTLCKAGKKTEAETVARNYAEEMRGTQDYQIMRSCADKYQSAMNDPAVRPYREQLDKMEAGNTKGICG